MLVVTILLIMAWWIVIVFFAFAIQLIPLKNYHENIAKVQLILSFTSIILGGFAFFYMKNNYSSGVFDGSRWNERVMTFFIGAYCWCFVGSLFRYYFDRKARSKKVETFILRAEEYKIVKKFDLLTADYVYMPNVKSYCEFDRGIIAFTGGMPPKESDCSFTCRMIKDGIYECLSYDLLSEEDNKLNFSKVKQAIFFVLTAIDLAFLIIWLAQDPNNIEIMSRLLQGLSFILFGAFGCNMFYGTKGFLAKYLFVFSVLFIIVGFISFFK